MKNLILSFILCFPLIAFSQDPVIEEFFNHYRDLENVSDIKLSGGVLKMVGSYSDEEGKKLLQKVSYLRILTIDNGGLVTKSDHARLLKNVKKHRYEALMQFRDNDGDDIQILTREEGSYVTDILLTIQGEGGFVLLSLEGKLRFSELNDLQLDFDGAEHFKRLPEDRKAVPRA